MQTQDQLIEILQNNNLEAFKMFLDYIEEVEENFEPYITPLCDLISQYGSPEAIKIGNDYGWDEEGPRYDESPEDGSSHSSRDGLTDDELREIIEAMRDRNQEITRKLENWLHL